MQNAASKLLAMRNGFGCVKPKIFNLSIFK